jgi:hypothetical protein
MTTRFITIFSVLGPGISYIGIRIVKLLARIAFATAILGIGIGITKVSGKVIHLNISAAKFFLNDNNEYCLEINTVISFLLG